MTFWQVIKAEHEKQNNGTPPEIDSKSIFETDKGSSPDGSA